MTSTRLQLLALPIAVASIAFAACGDDPNAGSSTADRRAAFQEAGLKHAECMRRNGIDEPDPKPGQGGILLRADPGVDPERLRSAEEKCRRYLEGLKPPEPSEQEQREFRDRALKFARCMREQGIDFPDPKFGANGSVQIQLRGQADDPRFQDASKKCSRYGPRIGGGPAGPDR